MKIAFIDTSFHKKTKSSIFFKDILRKNNEVIEIWDESWENKKTVDINLINSNNFDAIIFWQILLLPIDIEKLKCKNITWIPMYDTEIHRPFPFLQLIGLLNLNIKILSFSKALSKKFKKIGFNDIYEIQYYPKPNFKENNTEKINILFWQRENKINWGLVKKILGSNKIDNIYFKNNPDPKYANIKLPNKEDIKDCKIKIIDKWLDNDDYQNLLSMCNIYIAPRKYEGIGMGFLDAMATGLVIVSIDKPTANEYIKDGINGYLYKINKPKEINLSKIIEIKNESKNEIEKGYNIWQAKEKDIVEYIFKKQIKQNTTTNKILFFVYKSYCPIIKILKKLKKKIKNDK